MTAASLSQVESVVRYYDETRWDYRRLWGSDATLSMHFGYFDRDVHGHRQSLQRMNGFLADRLGVVRDDDVLDAGCGMGGSALWLASHVGCRVTAVNVTPYQLDLAAAAVCRAGLGDLVRLLLVDYTKTGLADGRFTVVWALESVVHAQSRADFVAEAFRLLVPGGRLMIAEYLLCEGVTPTGQDEALLRTWLDGWAMPCLISGDEYAVLLRGAGFDDVAIEDITDQVAPSLTRIGRLAAAVGPFVGPLHRLGLIRRRQLGNARAAAAQTRALTRGLWRYNVVLARRPC